jgi:hypothetical protein
MDIIDEEVERARISSMSKQWKSMKKKNMMDSGASYLIPDWIKRGLRSRAELKRVKKCVMNVE